MIEYICKICDKEFRNKTHLLNHQNKQKPCVKPKIFKCRDCDKIFSLKQNLMRHQNKYCKNNKIQKNEFINSEDLIMFFMKKIEEIETKTKTEIDKIKNDNQKYMTKIEQQDKDMKQLEQQIKKSKVTNIQNNDNKIQNNIAILAYGDEDLSHIKKEDLEKLFNSGHSSIPELVKLIHYNKSSPYNANMYISNLKTNFVVVFDGSKWILKQTDEHLTELFENSAEYLEDSFTNLLNALTKTTKNRFTRFLDQIEEDKTKSRIKDSLKLLMYNERNQPLRMIRHGNTVAIGGIPELT
jgi:DNA-directed RNA polymerase subunit RPC12/RpoP